MCVYLYIDTHMHMSIYIYISVRSLCVYICTHACIHIYMCEHVCVYIHIHTRIKLWLGQNQIQNLFCSQWSTPIALSGLGRWSSKWEDMQIEGEGVDIEKSTWRETLMHRHHTQLSKNKVVCCYLIAVFWCTTFSFCLSCPFLCGCIC